MNDLLINLQDSLNKIIVGKPEQIELAITGLLAKGHLLLEDRPGTGKTLMSLALAHLTGLSFKRVQFTNDLMPSDILGTQILDPKDHSFRLHKGPIFSQMVLADEINRATPKTQSALLEAMAEGQVSLDGETQKLPNPFFVIATQNPSNHNGTFPLPEAQLDRFMMRLSLGFASANDELDILAGRDKRSQLSKLEPAITTAQLMMLQKQAQAIHCSESVCAYVQRLLQYSRDNNHSGDGLSTRAGQSLVAAAKANALLRDDEFVMPQHVQRVFPAVTDHRMGHSINAVSLSGPTSAIIERVAV